jgi:hypothetical protein
VPQGSLAELAREKVGYALTMKEIIQKENPSLKISKIGVEGLAIPKP